MNNILGRIHRRARIEAVPQRGDGEKYPHVTFFFNDYREEPFPGEDRGMVASPKVGTYDLAPDMSSMGSDGGGARCHSVGQYDLLVVNYANRTLSGTPLAGRRRSGRWRRPTLPPACCSRPC